VRAFWLIASSVLVLFGADPSWKNKPTPAWTEEDARRILTASPWAKTVRAAIGVPQTEDERREGGNMGQERGVGFDGIDDNRPRTQFPSSVIDIVKPESGVPPPSRFLTLQLRWESALPIRVAELKSHVDSPSLGDGYSLAVYGVPDAHSNGGDPKTLGAPLKKQAVLKREGKQDVRPSSVGIFQREDGLVVVYLFPPSTEIANSDHRIEFDARIGRIAVAQSFNVDEMRFQGKLEL